MTTLEDLLRLDGLGSEAALRRNPPARQVIWPRRASAKIGIRQADHQQYGEMLEFWFRNRGRL